MSRIVIGPTLVKQATSHNWSPRDGFVFVPRWEGTHEAALGHALQLRNYGVPYRMRSDGVTAVVEAEQPMPDDAAIQEVPTGSWQLVGEEKTLDITEHPNFKALSSDDQTKIVEAKNRERTWVEYYGTADTMARWFHDLAYRGQTTFGKQVYVLRHTQSVSQQYDSSLSGSNIYKVYTKAQLLAECADFSNPLPAMFSADIDKIVDGATSIGFMWGWLKRTPTIQTVANDKIEVSVEYVYEEWSKALYNAI
jgi:hypothetical protein